MVPLLLLLEPLLRELVLVEPELLVLVPPSGCTSGAPSCGGDPRPTSDTGNGGQLARHGLLRRSVHHFGVIRLTVPAVALVQ